MVQIQNLESVCEDDVLPTGTWLPFLFSLTSFMNFVFFLVADVKLNIRKKVFAELLD